MALRTDYKDDILDLTQNTQRKYRMITNADGTVSFEDVTVYSQVGDSFGAFELNQIANVVNEGSGNIDYFPDEDVIKIKDAEGVWHDFATGGLKRTYLMQNGIVNTELVGTISNTGWYGGTTTYPIRSSQPVFSTTGFTITGAGGNSVNNIGVGGTENAVDLTDINKVCVTIKASSDGGALNICKGQKIVKYNDTYKPTDDILVAINEFDANTADRIVELNVSQLTGLHYLAVTTNKSVGTVEVGDWWLE